MIYSALHAQNLIYINSVISEIDPVFVLKLIGDSVDDGGSEECTARPPSTSDPANNGVAYDHRGPCSSHLHVHSPSR